MYNEAHIHLLVNHFPMIVTFVASALLFIAMLLHKNELKATALILLLFAGVMTIPAYISGEGAEHAVEEISGVSHGSIEEHEDLAEVGLWLMQGTAVIALVTLLSMRSKQKYVKWMIRTSLIASVVTLYFLFLVGNSGGLIRHSEIRTNNEQHE